MLWPWKGNVGIKVALAFDVQEEGEEDNSEEDEQVAKVGDTLEMA